MSVEVETVRTVEVPTRMVHGPGAIGRLGEIVEVLGVRRPLLVTDGGVVGAGLSGAPPVEVVSKASTHTEMPAELTLFRPVTSMVSVCAPSARPVTPYALDLAAAGDA